MSRQYLAEIPDYTPTTEWCEGDDRTPSWEKQTEKYGFDERQTWSLNQSMTELLYERLRFYQEEVNITYETAPADGSAILTLNEVDYSEPQVVQRMIDLAVEILTSKAEWSAEYKALTDELWALWALAHGHLWW